MPDQWAWLWPCGKFFSSMDTFPWQPGLVLFVFMCRLTGVKQWPPFTTASYPFPSLSVTIINRSADKLGAVAVTPRPPTSGSRLEQVGHSHRFPTLLSSNRTENTHLLFKCVLVKFDFCIQSNIYIVLTFMSRMF